MTKRALVLGGGGTVGLAWLTGVAAGLAENGVLLAEADLFVGTSAGSVASSFLAFGFDTRAMLALQHNSGGTAPPDSAQFDPATVTAVLERWVGAAEMTPELTRWLCDTALTASTIPEEAWLSIFALLPEEMGWPEKPLLVTAVDVYSGEFKVWDRQAGVPLYKAIASSCTVPGLFPPVTLAGSRYVDGGVRSGTNADLAQGTGKVLIIAPLGEQPGTVAYNTLHREMALLRARGSQVLLIHPDAESLAALGPNLMDPARRGEAAEAGVRQGRALVQAVRGFWGSPSS